MPPFALNQITTPNLHWRDFLALADRLGCSGVELRNDLGRPFFDGDSPEIVQTTARSLGLQIYGLSQVYPFNRWNPDRAKEVQRLIETACACGAATISLIPLNDPKPWPEEPADLRRVLDAIRPMVEGTGLRILIEPLGFARASLRTKAEVARAIEAAEAADVFGLVHDTFHHSLAQERDIFPDLTGMVHVSGVTRASDGGEFSDADRVLVTADDVLENITQLQRLIEAGYHGPVSMEAFSPEIQELDEPIEFLRESFQFILNSLEK